MAQWSACGQSKSQALRVPSRPSNAAAATAAHAAGRPTWCIHVASRQEHPAMPCHATGNGGIHAPPHEALSLAWLHHESSRDPLATGSMQCKQSCTSHCCTRPLLSITLLAKILHHNNPGIPSVLAKCCMYGKNSGKFSIIVWSQRACALLYSITCLEPVLCLSREATHITCSPSGGGQDACWT